MNWETKSEMFCQKMFCIQHFVQSQSQEWKDFPEYRPFSIVFVHLPVVMTSWGGSPLTALLALHESWRHVIKMIDLKMSIMGSFVLYQTTSIYWPWPEFPGEKSMKINNYFRHCMWVTESAGWVDNYGWSVIVIWFVGYWLSLYYHITIPPVAQHHGILSVLWVSKVVYFLSEAFWLTAPR